MNLQYLITGVLAYIGLTILQIFVLDQINIAGFGIPMVYPLVIMIIPVSVPAALVMIIAFFAGLLLDISTYSAGLHAGALTFMAFSRKYILELLKPSAGYDKNSLPTIGYQGFKWFSVYSLFMISTHQLAYYFIERFSMENLLFTLLRTISGVVVSVSLIWLIALLFSPVVRKRKR